MRGIIWGVSFFVLALAANQSIEQSLEILFTYYIFPPNEEAIATVVVAKGERFRRFRPDRIKAVIEYTYLVDNKSYHNDLIRFAPPWFNVREDLDNYKITSEHPVHYNSIFPSFSVLEDSRLEKDPWFDFFAAIVGGLIFCFLGKNYSKWKSN